MRIYKQLIAFCIAASISLSTAIGHAYYLEVDYSNFHASGNNLYGHFKVASVNVFSEPSRNNSFAIVKLTKHNSEEASEYAIYLHDISRSVTNAFLTTFQNMQATGAHIVVLKNDTQSQIVTQSSWHGVTKVFHVYPGDKVEIWSADRHVY